MDSCDGREAGVHVSKIAAAYMWSNAGYKAKRAGGD